MVGLKLFQKWKIYFQDSKGNINETDILSFDVVPACIDIDGDGYGDPANPTCEHAEWDCNDTMPLINPGVAEQCHTPYDDDCDGQINEGCGGVSSPIFKSYKKMMDQLIL